jgi:hypothetical protein
MGLYFRNFQLFFRKKMNFITEPSRHGIDALKDK